MHVDSGRLVPEPIVKVDNDIVSQIDMRGRDRPLSIDTHDTTFEAGAMEWLNAGNPGDVPVEGRRCSKRYSSPKDKSNRNEKI